MNVEEEKQAIREAARIYVIVQGVRIKITKAKARLLLFEKHGWIIEGVYSQHIVLTHDTISIDCN